MKLFLPTALLAVCAIQADAAPPRPPAPPPLPGLAQALQKISNAGLLEHIVALSSDDFEGRAPGTRGETVTLDYLQQQCKKLGLEPGNPDGTYVQAVPLVGISSHPTLSYGKPGGPYTTLAEGDDYVAWTARAEKTTGEAESELVFVGYGVRAPPFQWDDYKGADLRGKTLVMLINDPPVPDPKNPKRLDPAVFDGNAMSYYGRWNYKFAMAATMGAAAALIVHDSKTAGYPWEAVRNSWGRENYALSGRQADADFPAMAGWLRQDRARELFHAGGVDFDAARQAAATRGFAPMPLGVSVKLGAANGWREVASSNVVAKIVGSDPALRDEVVLYTAHWDHFGIDETLPGSRTEQIFHGAADNASGVAALLAIARAYKALPVAPKRSIVFLLTTAEERGLLGARHYARHPLYPLAKTLVNINVDELNLWGRTRDIELGGLGKSTADAVVSAVARGQGRVVRPDSETERGGFYRGDQVEFARMGVPVMVVRGGTDYIGKPAGWGRERKMRYTARQYHTVHDTVQADWDLAGAVEDVELLFQAGYSVAQGVDRPRWNDGVEFRAAGGQ